jgi:hypothetical protein
MKIAVIAVGAVLAVLLALHLVGARPEPGPEQQIMLAIADAEEAARRGSASDVVRIVSAHYADDAGYSRQDISRLAVGALRGGQQWHITTNLEQISVEQEVAHSRLRVTLWDSAWYDGDASWRISLLWRKEGRHWRVVSSSGWQQGAFTDAVGEDMPPSPMF